MKAHYPSWDISKSLDDIFSEIHQGWLTRRRTIEQISGAGLSHPPRGVVL